MSPSPSTPDDAAPQAPAPWPVERRWRLVDLPIAAGIFFFAWRMLMGVYDDLPLSPFGPDMHFWFQSAWGFETGDWSVAEYYGRKPLLPMLVALMATSPEAIAATSVRVCIALGALAPAFAWLAGVRLLGRAAAVVPIVLMWHLYDLWEVAYWFNGQVLINTLIVAELGLGYAAIRARRPWLHLALGATLGLMLLSREQAPPYVLVALAFAALPWLSRGPWRLGRQAGRVGLLLVGILAVTQPYAMTQPGGGGPAVKSMPLGDLGELMAGNTPHVATVQRWAPGYDLRWIQAGVGEAPAWDSVPVRTLRAMGRRAWSMFAPYHALLAAAAGGLLLLALPGAWGLIRPALWTLLHFAPVTATAITFGYPYHMTFVVGPLLVLAGFGPAALMAQGAALGRGGRAWRGWAGVGVAAALCAGALWIASPRVWSHGNSLEEIHKKVAREMRTGYAPAGAWLREHAPRNARVASGQQLAHLFAGLEGIPTGVFPMPHPDCRPPEGRVGAYYMVVDAAEAPVHWARFGLNGGPPSHFEEVWSWTDTRLGRTTTIYQIHTDHWAERIAHAQETGEAAGFPGNCPPDVVLPPPPRDGEITREEPRLRPPSP